MRCAFQRPKRCAQGHKPKLVTPPSSRASAPPPDHRDPVPSALLGSRGAVAAADHSGHARPLASHERLDDRAAISSQSGGAEPARGTVSYVSPLARAVLGGIVGDTVEVPGGAATITEIK